MFSITSPKLFRPLGPLSSFKIHQPLPLSNRDSKQLLNLLTTSFRQQLDREHGALEVDPSLEPTQTRRRPSHASSTTPLRPTDVHLNSILTNPLFAPRVLPNAKTLLFEPTSKRTPLEVFDEACARGLMNVKHAYAVLTAQKQAIRRSSIPSVSEGMRDSGAGSKVLKWLSSNGLINAKLFLEEPEFTALLIEYLILEDSSDIVWAWTKDAFKRCARSVGPTETKSENGLASHLLFSLVKSQAECIGLTLDEAYITMSKASKICKQSNISTHPLLSEAGCWLSYTSTMKSSKFLPASSSSYEAFVNIVPAFTRRISKHMAHLELHHPTHPSAKSALAYLKKLESKSKLHFPRQISRDVAIGLDTAKLLLEQGEFSDARWVMYYLQTTYPKELGLDARSSHDFELAKAEAETLELLRNLNFN